MLGRRREPRDWTSRSKEESGSDAEIARALSRLEAAPRSSGTTAVLNIQMYLGSQMITRLCYHDEAQSQL